MNESQFSREIRKSLDQFGWFRKMVGGGFIAPGIPDIIGCYRGQLIGIECKQIKTMPKRETSNVWHNLFTPDQLSNLQAIRDAGGTALGLIHIASNPREQYAVALVPIQLVNLNNMDLKTYNDLIKINRLFVIHRRNGIWSMEYLLKNLSKF